MTGLIDFSASRGDFYVPGCTVKVGGRDLVRELEIAFTQAEVDLVLGGAGRFSLTVTNCFDLERRAFVSGTGAPILDLLTFGAPVTIAMGYGDTRGLVELVSGTITEIGTTFPEGGYPELSIAGYDKAFPLTVGKTSKSWGGRSDSDIVADLARGCNLSVELDPTGEQHAQTDQNQESDLDFIRKLAERNHYVFYVRGDTLRFRKPRDRDGPVVSMSWGAGLISFKPEANLAGQVDTVEIFGWDRDRKEAIVGRAKAGSETGRAARGESGGELLKGLPGGNGATLRLRQPVFTQAEADTRAKAVLNERATAFLTGDAECFGLPEILPDANVQLDNLGHPFSATYYVTEATHKFDSGGYRARFKVRETTLAT